MQKYLADYKSKLKTKKLESGINHISMAYRRSIF